MDKKLNLKMVQGGESGRCPICESHYSRNDVFVCPECRTAYCQKHRVTGEKLCTSCFFENRLRELDTMHRYNNAVKSLSLLLQFLFLLSAILFVASRFEYLEVLDLEYLWLFADSSIYIAGGTLAGYLICFGIMYNQKNGIQKTESLLKRLEKG